MQDILDFISSTYDYIANITSYIYNGLLEFLGALASITPYLSIEYVLTSFFLFLLYGVYKGKDKSILVLINSLSFWFLKLINYKGMMKAITIYSWVTISCSIIILFYLFNTVSNVQGYSFYKVNASTLNARSGPNKNYRVVKELVENQKLQMIDASSSWYYMSDEMGEKFYVYKDYIDYTSEINYKQYKNEIFYIFLFFILLQNAVYFLLTLPKFKCDKCGNIFSFKEVKQTFKHNVAFTLGDFKGYDCDCNNGNLTCSSCNGDGDCPTCNGHGKLICGSCHGSLRCSKCAGNGKVDCSYCNGSGTIDRTVSRSSERGGNYQTTERCSHCSGSGHVRCYSCGSSGTCRECTSGKVTCSSCSGKRKCSNCGGSGNVTCGKCDGVSKYSVSNYSKIDFTYDYDECIYCTNKKAEFLKTKCQKCSSDITFSGNKYNYTKDINIDKTNKHISDKCNCAKVFYIEYSKPINDII